MRLELFPPKFRVRIFFCWSNLTILQRIKRGDAKLRARIDKTGLNRQPINQSTVVTHSKDKWTLWPVIDWLIGCLFGSVLLILRMLHAASRLHSWFFVRWGDLTSRIRFFHSSEWILFFFSEKEKKILFFPRKKSASSSSVSSYSPSLSSRSSYHWSRNPAPHRHHPLPRRIRPPRAHPATARPMVDFLPPFTNWRTKSVRPENSGFSSEPFSFFPFFPPPSSYYILSFLSLTHIPHRWNTRRLSRSSFDVFAHLPVIFWEKKRFFERKKRFFERKKRFFERKKRFFERKKRFF